MVINGIEFEFDASDQEHIARMEKALDKMDVAEKEIISLKDGKLAVMLERLNKMIADFFLDATGIDVLKGVTSYNKSKECYFLFLSEIELQRQALLQPYSLDRVR